MGIQFHCEHCRQPITAPDDSGGRQGRCPHCKGTVYIPTPAVTDDDEIPLAPLDDEDERKRDQATREARALQFQLAKEQAVPGEPAPRKTIRTPDPKSAAAHPTAPVKELNRYVVQYVEALAAGRLDEAEKLVARLAQHRLQVLTILETMASEDLSAYGLPALPRPVLLGFLKQLRTKLQQGPA